MKNGNVFPEPTLRRLSIYYNYLKEQAKAGKELVSSTDIANTLNFVPIQVRKDIEMTGITGKPKTGYNINELIVRLEEFLGWKNTYDAFLIGAGNLGYAILGYKGFNEKGINIVAAFDNDPKKIGKEIKGKPIYPLKKFEDLVRRMKVKIGILTVPAEFAQEIADIMVSSGIKAIWNFTHTRLNIPDDIIVQEENLASSLAIMIKKLVDKSETVEVKI